MRGKYTKAERAQIAEDKERFARISFNVVMEAIGQDIQADDIPTLVAVARLGTNRFTDALKRVAGKMSSQHVRFLRMAFAMQEVNKMKEWFTEWRIENPAAAGKNNEIDGN